MREAGKLSERLDYSGIFQWFSLCCTLRFFALSVPVCPIRLKISIFERVLTTRGLKDLSLNKQCYLSDGVDRNMNYRTSFLSSKLSA